jgi:FtsZ-binding cell division protein ZapB
MYGLLLLAIAIALVFLRPVRERFTEITAPPYSQTLKDEFWATLSPPEKDAVRSAVRTMQMTEAQVEPAAIEKVASIVAEFYPQYSATLTQTVLRSKIDAYAGTQSGLRAVATRVLTAYFVETPATGTTQTGTTGATQTGATGGAAAGSIQVPDVQRIQSGGLPYTDAETERIVNLSQTAKAQVQARIQQLQNQSTPAQQDYLLKLQLTGVVARFYEEVYTTLTRPVQDSDIDAFVTRILQPPTDLIPEQQSGLKDLLTKYYMGGATGAAQTGTTQTGTTQTGTAQTGTTQTGATAGSIQVPNLSAPGVIPFYSDAEMNRIQSLVPTAYSQLVSSFTTAGETPSNAATLARNSLATIIAQFYVAVYSSLTRPVQTSDIDAFLPTLPASVRPPPEVFPAIKELLMKYYMGTAASQGPSFQQPRSYAELDALYKAKLAEYQTKVTEALRTNDTSALPAIRTLNAEISQLLEEMLSSLDPLRQDTETTRRQREELVTILAQIQREQTGLQDEKDSFGRVRRIREMQQGVKESDLKLYAVLFVSACIAVFVIALSKS